MIVLDAGAFLALVKREPGAATMRQILRIHHGETLIHAAQLLEIYYGIEQGFGRTYAERVWLAADKIGVLQRDDFDRDFLRDAAFLKVNHKMSFADTFGLALARRLNCQFVSTDHHELDAVKAAGVCDVLFIR